MRTAHDEVMDDLAALVAGEAAAISKHADHLASCDACRDARHEASALARKMSDAGSDYVADAALVDRVMTKIDANANVNVNANDAPAPKSPTPTPTPRPTSTFTPTSTSTFTQKRKMWIVAGAAAALAAGVVGVAMMKSSDNSARSPVASGGPIGKLKTISRAAANQGDGIAIKTDSGWRPLRADEMIPAGAELRTDERTRASLAHRARSPHERLVRSCRAASSEARRGSHRG
jgi:hypothetical protein